MTKAKHVHLSIPSASEFVGVVRLAVSGIAARIGFAVDEIEDIKIAVSEACTNAIQHAHDGGDESATVLIDCDVFPESLEITVKDSGKGFDLSKIGSKEQRQASEEKLGLGLGLTFIKNLMDELDIQTNPGEGTVLKMTKYKAKA